MRTRQRLLFAAGGLLAGCVAVLFGCTGVSVGGCSDIGCTSQVTFVTDAPFTSGRTYEVTACAEAFCRSATVRSPEASGDFAAPGSDHVEVSSDGTVVLVLPDGDDGHNRRVSLRITDDTGRVVADAAQTTGFERIQPNGPACRPICWLAEITI